MENAEEILQSLDEFTKCRPKVIPRELEDYISHVARTGDPVYQWPLIKSLFKEKLANVLADFASTSPGLDIPLCPNVDFFNFESMKNGLLERLDAFSSAPFTIQRICELLTSPRKQYNRIDKYMRAVEKNILVVSTREPGPQRHSESENGEQMDSIVNGSDSNSEYNVDVEMEDMTTWKESTTDAMQVFASQSGSSDNTSSLKYNIQNGLDSAETDTKITLTPSVLEQTSGVDNDDKNAKTDKEIPSCISTDETTVTIESIKHDTMDSTSTDICNENILTSQASHSSVSEVSIQPILKEESVIVESGESRIRDEPTPMADITIDDNTKLAEVANAGEDDSNSASESSNDGFMCLKDASNEPNEIAGTTITSEEIKKPDLTEEGNSNDVITSGDESSSSNSSDNNELNSNSSSCDMPEKMDQHAIEKSTIEDTSISVTPVATPVAKVDNTPAAEVEEESAASGNEKSSVFEKHEETVPPVAESCEVPPAVLDIVSDPIVNTDANIEMDEGDGSAISETPVIKKTDESDAQ